MVRYLLLVVCALPLTWAGAAVSGAGAPTPPPRRIAVSQKGDQTAALQAPITATRAAWAQPGAALKELQEFAAAYAAGEPARYQGKEDLLVRALNTRQKEAALLSALRVRLKTLEDCSTQARLLADYGASDTSNKTLRDGLLATIDLNRRLLTHPEENRRKLLREALETVAQAPFNYTVVPQRQTADQACATLRDWPQPKEVTEAFQKKYLASLEADRTARLLAWDAAQSTLTGLVKAGTEAERIDAVGACAVVLTQTGDAGANELAQAIARKLCQKLTVRQPLADELIVHVNYDGIPEKTVLLKRHEIQIRWDGGGKPTLMNHKPSSDSKAGYEFDEFNFASQAAGRLTVATRFKFAIDRVVPDPKVPDRNEPRPVRTFPDLLEIADGSRANLLNRDYAPKLVRLEPTPPSRAAYLYNSQSAKLLDSAPWTKPLLVQIINKLAAERKQLGVNEAHLASELDALQNIVARLHDHHTVYAP